jgi:hypothetical protein
MNAIAHKGRSKRPRIFVSMAAYRDPECQHTVKELFENAKHPQRIFVGIVWQGDKALDRHCFEVPAPRPKQVRLIEVDWRQSKGASWARAQKVQLWHDEEYLFQIDSHMRFEPDWDETLIGMHRACPSAKAVLTTYPAGYTPPRHIPHRVTHGLKAKEFDQHGIFTMGSWTVPQDPPPDLPVLGAFVGSMMLFGPASMIREVPYDQHLYFFGEEITLAARLWTHGYDIYHPPRPVVYHYWDRSARRTHFDDHANWGELNALSFARVRHLLGTQTSTDPAVLAEIERYGLGTTRSLQEYQEFCGVDFATRQITRNALEGHSLANQANGAAAQAPSPHLSMPCQPMTSPPACHSGPRKMLETPDAAVYDDFLPQDVYDRLFDFVSQMDYEYINTQGKVNRAWDLSNGFPLHSENTVYYHPEGVHKPDGRSIYPCGTPLDRFIENVNRIVLGVSQLIGAPSKEWEHYSVTAWLYPPNTGLAMHEDGTGVYSGAYAFFLNKIWRPHWGGLLIVLDPAANVAIKSRKQEVNAYQFHKQRWLHLSEHDELAMEHGLGQCIFPKANRMVFIHPDAFHMVTQVAPAAGDHVRMSLAGFFHKAKP